MMVGYSLLTLILIDFNNKIDDRAKKRPAGRSKRTELNEQTRRLNINKLKVTLTKLPFDEIIVQMCDTRICALDDSRMCPGGELNNLIGNREKDGAYNNNK